MSKTVSEIIIDRFIKDVDEKGTMPWQRPYVMDGAFNFFTMKAYRGINRFLLPSGEYISANQMYQYNKQMGFIKRENGKDVITSDAYRMQKGIEWYPVVYFNVNSKEVSRSYIEESFPKADLSVDGFIGKDNYGYSYVRQDGKFFKRKTILRYYSVADIHHFKNSKGECPPSKIDTGEVVITKQDAKKVITDYIKRENIKLVEDYKGIPCYLPSSDTIALNPHMKNEEEWFSTAFHECSHSTGSINRLNRECVVHLESASVEDRAKEECIAELSACLCCAETGIYSFETSCTRSYDNNIAYVQSWKRKIKEWGNNFIWICSQADKAFNFICNNPDLGM